MAVCAYSAGIDMTHEALKLALEALEANDQLINGTGTNGGLVYCMDGYYSDCFDVDPINKQTEEAITAIKEALAKEKTLQALHHENERLGLYKDAYAQPEQEPVAWMDADGKTFLFVWNVSSLGVQQGSKYLDETLTPLYTTPPQRTWVGLTSDEIANMFDDWPFKAGEFARAIEAKLKEKNCAG